MLSPFAYVSTLFLLILWTSSTALQHSSWTEQLPSNSPQFRCIAIVTGYPELSQLYHRLQRLLYQLLHELHALPDAVHVFCQGDCSKTFPNFHVNYHTLNNTVSRKKYRGFIISRNYKLLFEHLFDKLKGVKYCMILEDDLVLSDDSIAYMNAGAQLMDQDPSIFTVSLYNDNAYPWCSSNSSFFRRISHFSGLGFLMSKRCYQDLVKDNWDEDKVWDHNLQAIMAANHMVSIQPEVNRVLHTPDISITNTHEKRRVYSKYLSQVASQEPSTRQYDLTHLQKDTYAKFLQEFIQKSQIISSLYQAAFYKVDQPLLYTACDKKRPCLDGLLRENGLNGAGLGSMVRGIYQGTLFLRVYERLVLIVLANSPFSDFIPTPDLTTEKTIQDESHMAGLLHHIKETYNMSISTQPHLSCTLHCKSLGQECSRTGLWLLNTECSVLQKLVSECMECQDKADDKKISATAPVMLDQGMCVRGFPHSLHCDASTPAVQHKRICTCH